jgi:hypothetical protein
MQCVDRLDALQSAGAATFQASIVWPVISPQKGATPIGVNANRSFRAQYISFSF